MFLELKPLDKSECILVHSHATCFIGLKPVSLSTLTLTFSIFSGIFHMYLAVSSLIPSRSPREPNRSLLVELRENMRFAEGQHLHLVEDRLQVKRQEIWEKLFNPVAPLRALKHLPPMLVEEQRPEGAAALTQPSVAEDILVGTQQAAHTESDAPCSSPPPPPPPAGPTHGHASTTPSSGERLFVFRAPQESHDAVDFPRRKKKRNFLNLKKCSVAPTNPPGDA